MNNHAFLSPSFGKIGYVCPAAAIRSFQVKQRLQLLREILPEFYGLKSKSSIEQLNAILREDNSQATEGTALHVIFEDCLNARKCSIKEVTRAVRNSVDVTDETKQDDYIITMLEKVIREQIKFVNAMEWVGVEQKVKVKGLPQFGTVDLVTFKDRTLYIRDLKTGYNQVDSEENEQLMTYAIGLLDEFGWDKFDEVKIQILGVRWQAEEWVTTPSRLKRFKVEVMLPAFMEAYSIAPRAVAGSHCHYCVAKIHCKEWQDKFKGLENRTFGVDVVDLDNEELSELYKLCKQAENLAKYQLSPELLHRFDGFDTPSGVSRVSGRVNEYWSEGEEEVVKKLKTKVKDVKELYTQSLKSPKKMKLILKGDEEFFDGMINKTLTKPYLKLK